MAFNIMDLVNEHLTPDNIRAVAGMLGEDEEKTTSGLSGVITALLAALVGSLSKPESRTALNDAVDTTDSGLIGNLAGALGGGDGKSLITNGLSLASSLFGDDKVGKLGGAISAFSGFSSDSSKSLLGVGAPMLMSMLSQKKKSEGMDSGGLVDMLMGQKENVAKAISPDLNSALSASGLLNDLIGTAGAHAREAAGAAVDTVQQTARQGKSLSSRLIPLLLIVLVGWLAFQYLSKPKPVEEAVQQVGGVTMEALNVDNVNVGQEITTFFESTGEVLAGISDDESARNALTALGELNQSLDSISGLAAKLSPEGLQLLTDTINNLKPGLEKAMNTAYAIPGVQEALGDTMNNLLQKLSALSKS